MINTDSTLPILYSLRNCPYAMRARIAIFKAQQIVMLRDIVLSNKPKEMITASPKATVPVLVLANGTVVDESLAIMLWALNETDPDDLLQSQNEHGLSAMLNLIKSFDHDFKVCLEQYKCAKRYRENNTMECRIECEGFIQTLENRLNSHDFLMSNTESLADIALLPFIRQFARIERQWYLQSPYPKVRQWLNNYLQSPMFTKVMAKYPLWLDNHEVALFGSKSK
ncbi:MAG: glutathione S-transferase [Colwellia sp.]|jgi:glutathione S-transferase